MKKIRKQAIILLFAFFISAVLAGAVAAEDPAWQTETVVSDEYAGQYNSIAVDSNDNPHIAYSYFNSEWERDELKYAYKDESGWKFENIDSDGGVYPSITLDSNNNPHISYTDGDSSNLKYTTKINGIWVIKDLGQLDEKVGYTSIALDSNGYPHITFKGWRISQSGSIDTLYYIYKDSNGWSLPEIIDENSGWGNSLKLDSNNKPHVSYYKNQNDGLTMHAYKNNANEWITSIVDSGTGYTSLQLDSMSKAHISYTTSGPDSLKYASELVSGWNIEVVETGAGYFFTGLTLDSKGNPHISYLSQYNKIYSLKHAYFNEGQWITETIKSPVSEGNTGIAIDSKNNIHVSAHGSLEYAYLAAGEPEPNSDQVSQDPSNMTVNAKTTTETVGMQETGLPIPLMVFAILMILGGLIGVKRD